MHRALVLFAALAFVGIASASHLRYGSASLKKSPTNPLTVTFTLTTAARRSFGYAGGVNVGNQIQIDTFYFGDGTYASPSYVINNADVAGDVVYGTATVTHTYRNSGTYRAYGSVCCRISDLNNNADEDFFHDIVFTISAAEIADPTLINNSPSVNSLPIIFVPLGVANYQYSLTAQDDEGDSLTFSMATSEQMIGYSSSTAQPAGLSVSANGLVTLSTTLSQGFWSTQQLVSDGHGNIVAVDYLLDVQPIQSFCNNSCAAPCSSSSPCSAGPCGPTAPACLQANPRIVTASITGTTVPRTNLPSPVDGDTLSFNAGGVYYINFVADDSNLVNSPNTPVAISAAGLPAGVTAEAQTACDATSSCQYVGPYATPQLRRYRFAPTAAQMGTSGILCIGAVSGGTGLSYSQHCVTLAVNNVPASVCGNAIVETGEDCDGGDCCTTTCTFATSATTCRAINGPCDVAETCSGSSSACPTDAFASASTVCRLAVDSCDVPETCDGVSTACPANQLSNSSACFCARVADPNADPNIPVSTYYCSTTGTQFYQCMSGLWAALSANQPCAAGTLCQCPQGVDCSCAGNPCTIPGDVPNC